MLSQSQLRNIIRNHFLKHEKSCPSHDYAVKVLDNDEQQSLAQSLDNFYMNQQRVLLVLGDAGMGKTVTLKKHVNERMTSPDLSRPISIYIDCKNLNDSFEQLVSDYFLSLGLGHEVIDYLKENCHFNFIFDGYDASFGRFKLFPDTEHSLRHWNIHKIVISCRTSYLYGNENYLDLFQYDRNAKSVSVVNLLPMEQADIYDVLKAHDCVNAYEALAISIPAFKDLARNRLMLTLMIEIITSSHEEISIESLLNAWLNRQLDTLLSQQQIMPDEVDNLRYHARSYVVATARRLYEFNEIAINFKTKLGARRLRPIKARWEKFLLEDDRMTSLARSCCPFQSHSPSELTLYSRHVVKALSQLHYPIDKNRPVAFLNGYEGSEVLCVKLNVHLNVDNPDELNVWRASLSGNANSHYQTRDFVQIIRATRWSEEIATAGANAISYLNKIQCSLSGADFSNVDISFADLSDGIFDRASFKGSKMHHVNLRNAWCRKANFQGADLRHANFSQYPYIESDTAFKKARFFINPVNQRYSVLSLDGHDVKQWDLDSGELMLALSCEGMSIKDICVSQNGQTMMACSANKVLIWHLSPEVEKNILTQDTDISCVAISRDGSHAALAGINSVIYIIDTLTGQRLHVLWGHITFIRSLVFSYDGTLLFSGVGDEDCEIKVWDVQKGEELYELTGHELGISGIDISQDGKRLVSCSEYGFIFVWDLIRQEVSYTFESGGSHIALSADGRTLITSAVNKVRLWNLGQENASLKQIYSGQTSIIQSVDISANAQYVISASVDRTLYIWNNQPSIHNESIPEVEMEVNDVKFSFDGKQLASASSYVRVWDVDSGHCMNKFECGTDCSELSFGFNHKTILGAYYDGSVITWDIETGKLLHETSSSGVSSTAVATSRGFVVSSGPNQQIYVSSLQDNTLKYTLTGHDTTINCLAISSDELILASGSDDALVRTWDLSIGKLLNTFQHDDGTFALAMTADMKCLVTAGFSGEINIWDLNDGNHLQRLEGHKHSVHGVAICQDDSMLSSVSSDATVRLWDLTQFSLESVCTINISNPINGVDFRRQSSPPWGQLVISTTDGSVQYWEALTQDCTSWKMCWSSQALSLNFYGADFRGTHGLDVTQFKLLKQNEAIIDPEQLAYLAKSRSPIHHADESEATQQNKPIVYQLN